MPLAEAPEHVPVQARGEVRFLDAEACVRSRSAVEAAGWMLVTTEALGPGVRGLLGRHIEERIDHALSQRGAPPPGIAATSDPQEVFEDQLLRARAAGISGIALALGSLGALVGSAGALEPEDSQTLAMLALSSRVRPFALWLSPDDSSVRAYGRPIPLGDLLDPSSSNCSNNTAVYAPASADVPADDGSHVDSDLEASPPPAHRTAKRDTSRETSASKWRAMVRDLDDAQGPKPLAAVEKLFVERYVPLAQAVARAETEARACQSLQRFSKSFEKSYREAFAAAKVTRKRPPMVLDVPHVAARVARLHGARTTVLLLVDAMRFDLGQRMQELLRAELTPDAVCTEHFLLWSALPTSTSMQLHLLSRGVEGLVEPLDPDNERELIIPHGKAASTVRRMKVGGREIHKLDVVQSLLNEPGPREDERIEALAREAYEPIVKFARGLQSRTLLFVFGDHGFEFPHADLGTGPAKQGGGTPEQVLVPGYAWLIGGIH